MIGYNILPIGFSSYEKSTIETFFRLAGRRAPHWTLTTRSHEARVVLFNVTPDQNLESFRAQVASWQKAIIIGDTDFGTGWPLLPRPIKLTAILTLLDDVVMLKASDKQKSRLEQSASILPAPVIANPNATDMFASVTTKAVVAPSVKVASSGTRKPTFTEATKPISAPLKEVVKLPSSSSVSQVSSVKHTKSSDVVGRVLLVDDSDIALKYMQNRLRHFSYECDMVHSGEEALAMVATRNYQFVFLDVMMAGLDGYQTCKAIKNNKARQGPAPVVVMLTSKGGTIDKIRGSMAGCDAYLTKPLNDKKLGAVLAKYDDSTVAQRWTTINPRQPLIDTYVPRSR